MASFSRRAFLKRTGTGAAAAGVLAVLPSLAEPAGAAQHQPSATRMAAPVTPTSSKDPLVVHIPDTRTGEVHLMIGTREVVTNDRALVARLLRDAR